MASLRMRWILAVAGILLAVVYLVPNIFPQVGDKWITKNRLNYGLDIQGGLHLVMGVDVSGVVGESAQRMGVQIKTDMAKESVIVTDSKLIQPKDGEIEFTVAEDSKASFMKLMGDRYGTVFQKMKEDGNKVSYRYYENYLHENKQKVLQQAMETIRNRIDEFGVAEPSISQQGDDRILVQLPGMEDAEKAKALISTAARLDFMIVSNEKSSVELQQLIDQAEKAGNYSVKTMKYSDYVNRLNQDLVGKIPEKTIVYFQKPESAANFEAGKVPFLLKTDTGLGGESLSDAFVHFDQYGAPQVNLTFNPLGTNKFADITEKHIHEQMAIVLDKVVKTAPSINSKIAEGRAVITLGSSRDPQKSMDEAKMIATSLRAGALPASLEQLEERRVGPSLGADSIHKAKFASYLGAFIILIFMMLRYRGMGVVSDISLAFNILTVFALLAALGATLTLPGIAGIALTVGFAVDANVLINERMREELRKGATFKMAVQDGYSRAMSAILDANVTTAATAIVLLYFGTGPVRGFAVTLLIGIVTTLFANVFISKVIVDLLIHRWGVKKISV